MSTLSLTSAFSLLLKRDLTLAYVGTDIDKSDCFGGTKDCQGNAVFTISKSL